MVLCGSVFVSVSVSVSFFLFSLSSPSTPITSSKEPKYHVPVCTIWPDTCCIWQDRSGRFFDGETLPHSAYELPHATCCPQLSSKGFSLDHFYPIRCRHFLFTLLQSPHIVTLHAQVDRLRCTSSFWHNSRNFEDPEPCLPCTCSRTFAGPSVTRRVTPPFLPASILCSMRLVNGRC